MYLFSARAVLTPIGPLATPATSERANDVDRLRILTTYAAISLLQLSLFPIWHLSSTLLLCRLCLGRAIRLLARLDLLFWCQSLMALRLRYKRPLLKPISPPRLRLLQGLNLGNPLKQRPN